MSTISRRYETSHDSFETEVVAQKDMSVILLNNFLQKNKDDKIENILENDSIQIVVGANKYNKTEQTLITVDPLISSAGIFINEAVKPAYVFNPKRKEDGLILNQVVDPTNDKETSQKIINETENGISTITMFADHIQMVSYLNGINLYTTPKVISNLRGLPTISDGAGVSLIHGNSIETLEPMVKAKKLDDALLKLQASLSETNYSVFQLGLLFTAFLSLFAAHFHITPQIPAGALPSLPSIEGIIFSIGAVPTQIKSQIDNVISEINSVINKINRSSAFESTYHSDHHKLN